MVQIGGSRAGHMTTRWALVALAVIAAGSGGASAQSSNPCPYSVPMFHGLDSYFQCADALPVAALAYQISAPDSVNTGTADIICDTIGGVNCSDLSGLGDGMIQVQTDWGNPGISGCPYPVSGPQRIVIVVQGTDGRGLIASLSGADYNIGYLVEAAHKYDPATGLAYPLPCSDAAGQPKVVSRTTGADGRVTLDLHLAAPLVFTDCDPDSVGVAGGLNTCPDAFTPNSSVARLYTSVQPCNRPPDIRRTMWTDSGVAPDPAGNASITITPPATETCALVGYTATIGGYESGAVVGFVKVPGVPCRDLDADGWTQCEGDCDDARPEVHPGAVEVCNLIDDNCNGVVDEANCAPLVVDMRIAFGSPEGRGSGVLSWTSTREIDLAGFNVVMLESNGRRTQVNSGPIPCAECSTGRSHAYTYIVPKHKSGRNFFVEMVFVDDRVVTFGPAVKQ